MVDGYGEDKTVVGKRIEKDAKTILTCVLGMVLCIGSSIPKWYAREISELKHFGELLWELDQTFEREVPQ